MKEKIHPKYIEATVTCGCGETFKTRSTKDKIVVEICSKCHPFFTGKQKLVDSAGMVERFTKRWQSGTAQNKAIEMEKKKAKVAVRQKARQEEQAVLAPPPPPKPKMAKPKPEEATPPANHP